jgi:hypothetical protein
MDASTKGRDDLLLGVINASASAHDKLLAAMIKEFAELRVLVECMLNIQASTLGIPPAEMARLTSADLIEERIVRSVTELLTFLSALDTQRSGEKETESAPTEE